MSYIKNPVHTHVLNKGHVTLTPWLSQSAPEHLTLLIEECKWRQQDSRFWPITLAKVGQMMLLEAGE